MLIAIVALMIFRISDFCMGDEDNFKWTPELDARILDIFYATRPNEVNHQNRMKEMWDKIYPQFKDVEAKHLRLRAINLIFKSGGTNGRIHWTPELESDLLRMYHNTINVGGRGLYYRLHNQFYSKHINQPRLTPQGLWERAKVLTTKDNRNRNRDGVRTSWSSKHADELIKIYHKYPSNKRDQALKLFREWIKSHPEHKNKNPCYIQSQMRRVAQNRAEDRENSKVFYYKRYKWSRQQFADLLHIHNQLRHESDEYMSRMEEYWRRMYPELSYMKKSYLRRQVYNLLQRDYKPAESEEEIAKRKFDNLPVPEDDGEREEEPCRMDRGKRIIDSEHMESMSPPLLESHPHRFHDFMSVDKYCRPSPNNFDDDAAKHSTAMSPRFQDLRPHYFHDFIPVNEFHGESSHRPDENVLGPHMASSSREPSSNTDAFPHHGYHSDSAANSPSKNLPKYFFRFL